MSETVGRAAYPDLDLDLDEGITREVLAQLDEAETCSEHWKILLTAGMGFFTDAYDLFIIGVAATIIASQWHIAGYQKSLLSSLALLTSAAGAVVFGRLADKLGRRRVYGYEVLVLGGGRSPRPVRPASGGSSSSEESSASVSGVTTRSARRS